MICVVFFRHYDNTIHCPLTETLGAFNIFTSVQHMYQGHRNSGAWGLRGAGSLRGLRGAQGLGWFGGAWGFGGLGEGAYLWFFGLEV